VGKILEKKRKKRFSKNEIKRLRENRKKYIVSKSKINYD
jgi:hypothetical protein